MVGVLLQTCSPLSVTDSYVSAAASLREASCAELRNQALRASEQSVQVPLHELVRVQHGLVSWLLRCAGKCSPSVVPLRIVTPPSRTKFSQPVTLSLRQTYDTADALQQ